MNKTLSLLLLSIFTTNALAVTTTAVTVDKVRIAKSAAADNAEVTVAITECGNGILYLALNDETDRVALSMLMTAKATGQPVVITYNDTLLCQIEQVRVDGGV